MGHSGLVCQDHGTTPLVCKAMMYSSDGKRSTIRRAEKKLEPTTTQDSRSSVEIIWLINNEKYFYLLCTIYKRCMPNKRMH